ncbi:MAG: Smr/MutS family protein [Pseudomonadota bacterium]
MKNLSPPSGDEPDKTRAEDDRDLFRQEVGEVRPLRSQRQRTPARPPPPDIKQTRRDEARVLDELKAGDIDWTEVETGEELSFLRDGLSPKILRRLRRGHYSVGDELDLHHMNIEAARASIIEFLESAQRRHISCVRIIHGKGLRSKHRGPVLKGLTNSLLRRRKAVVAFTSARPSDGGTGAVYVLLRS